MFDMLILVCSERHLVAIDDDVGRCMVVLGVAIDIGKTTVCLCCRQERDDGFVVGRTFLAVQFIYHPLTNNLLGDIIGLVRIVIV